MFRLPSLYPISDSTFSKAAWRTVETKATALSRLAASWIAFAVVAGFVAYVALWVFSRAMFLSWFMLLELLLCFF